MLSKDLQVTLWKKRYNFDKANAVVKQVQKMAQEKLDTFSKKSAAKQETKDNQEESVAEVNPESTVINGTDTGQSSTLTFNFSQVPSYLLLCLFFSCAWQTMN